MATPWTVTRSRSLLSAGPGTCCSPHTPRFLGHGVPNGIVRQRFVPLSGRAMWTGGGRPSAGVTCLCHNNAHIPTNTESSPAEKHSCSGCCCALEETRGHGPSAAPQRGHGWVGRLGHWVFPFCKDPGGMALWEEWPRRRAWGCWERGLISRPR